MALRVALPALAAGAALLVAGCGGRSEPTVGSVAKCLRTAGVPVTTDASKLGFVATSAPAGALQATVDGNRVTIAFGDSVEHAIGIEKAYHRFAPLRLRARLGTILERQDKVVLLWSLGPTRDESGKVHGCLT